MNIINLKTIYSKFKIYLVFFLVLLISAMPVVLEGANLIAIVVANTLPIEKNLGRKSDVQKILEELEVISELTGLKLDLTLYIHEEYNDELLNRLENINVNPDDVLFFFYSGHGFRDSHKDPHDQPWPNIKIDLQKKGIDQTTITEILMNKGARILFSLVNSCNKTIKEHVELIPPPFLMCIK